MTTTHTTTWHPHWCWQRQCDTTDPAYVFHTSHPRNVQASGGEIQVFTDLTVNLDGTEPTSVEIVVSPESNALSPNQARSLAGALMMAAAEGERAVVDAVRDLDGRAQV